MLNKKKRILVCIGAIVFFLVTSLIFFRIGGWRVLFGKPVPYLMEDSNDLSRLTGHILFTGDTFGKVQPAGCSRVGSLARRVKVITQFPHYLYLDFGNLAGDSSFLNSIELPYLLDAYRYIPLGAFNLGKTDYVYFAEHGIVPSVPFVSANLRIESPAAFKERLKPYILLPLVLRNRKETRRVTVGITGITGNERLLYPGHWGPAFTVSDPAAALNAIKEPLEKADIAILLYNDSFHNLEPLLEKIPVRFDLVFASASTQECVNTMKRIKDSLVAFTEEEGKSLGHVRVTVKENEKGFQFDYNVLIPGLGGAEDAYIKERVKQLEHVVAEQKQKNLEQHAKMNNRNEKDVKGVRHEQR